MKPLVSCCFPVKKMFCCGNENESKISFAGIFLVLVGLFWIARDFGLIPGNISTLAALFVVFGLILVLKKLIPRR